MQDATPHAYEDLTQQAEVEAIMSAGSGPVVIDFWSRSCGPCMAMGPHFEHVAKEHTDDPIRFCKINTQEAPNLAAPFRIRAVPTLLFILDGEIIDSNVGALDARRLEEKVKYLLSRSRGEGFLHRLFGLQKKKPS